MTGRTTRPSPSSPRRPPRASASPCPLLQTRSAQRNVAASWVDDLDDWAGRFPDLEVTRSDLPSARANEVLGAATPSPLMVISVGHGSLLHRSLDGPHRWLLRHCTSPMALVPTVHRSTSETAGEASLPA